MGPSLPFLRDRNLHIRALTACILLVLGVPFFMFAPVGAIQGLILLLGIGMVWEWHQLHTGHTRAHGFFWLLAGSFYIGGALGGGYILFLEHASEPKLLLLMIISCIIATDVGAYLIGKNFGRHKLAPKISPNKTWEGLIGGVFCAVATAFIFLESGLIFTEPLPVLGAGVLIAVLSQAGDLFISYLKRKKGVKDTGCLLPGHGGLLDRFDGYLSVGWLLFFLYCMH